MLAIESPLSMRTLVIFTLLAVTICAQTDIVTFRDGTVPINTGEVDSTFALSHVPNGDVRAVQILRNGNILLGGSFTQVGSINQAYLAMFDHEGSFVTSYRPTLDGPVNVIAQYAKDPFLVEEPHYVGGEFHTVNGSAQRGLARLLNDGTSDPSFSIGAGFNGSVNAIHASYNGLFVGGSFSSLSTAFNTTAVSNFVTIDPESAYLRHDHDSNGPIYTIVRDVGSFSVLVGGDFTMIGGQSRSYTAEVDINSYELSEREMGIYNGAVRHIAINGPSVTITTAGDFTQFNGAPVPGVASYYSPFFETDQPVTKNIPNLPNSTVTSLASDQLGSLYLGFADGTIRHYYTASVFENEPWTFNDQFSSISPPSSASILAIFLDTYFDQRVQFQPYLGTAFISGTDPVLRLYGLHGSGPPAAPEVTAALHSHGYRIVLSNDLNITGHEIQLSSDHGLTWTVVPEDQTLFTVNSHSGLRENEDYQLRIRQKTSNGLGVATELSFTTPAFSPHEGTLIPLPDPLLTPAIPFYSNQQSASVSSEGNFIYSDVFATDKEISSGFFSTEYEEGLVIHDPQFQILYSDLGEFDGTPYIGFFDTLDRVIVGKKNATGMGITRLNSDFTPDPNYNVQLPSTAPNRINRLYFDKLNDRFYVVQENQISGQASLEAYEIDGRSTPDFVSELPEGEIVNVLPLANGELLVFGYFSESNGGTYQVAKLSATGVILMTLPSAPNEYVSAIAVDSLGRILTLMNFSPTGQWLRRYNSDGSLDTSFLPTFTRSGSNKLGVRPEGIHLLQDEKILVCGFFDACDGVPTPGLVRICPNGEVDTTFQPNLTGINSPSYVISAFGLPDGSVIIGGEGLDSSRTRKRFIQRLRGSLTPASDVLWAQAHGLEEFGTGTEDIDGDGLARDIEYAYNLNPNLKESFSPFSMSGKHLQITPPIALDTEVKAYFTEDLLVPWNEVPIDARWGSQPTQVPAPEIGFFRMSATRLNPTP